ncbi:MAG: hypothetical protein EON54_22940 [Alcaligenaceae bacterium]|nr:MAG: hypothetical protein EON54_22940 [Alcaligenaceae bacterium]
MAVVANVSDLLAVGAVPRALMVSLVVPGSFDADDACAIVKGCEEACENHGIAFVGGDTKEGPTPQVIGAAWGTVEKGAAFGRASAKPGDYLFLAGKLGAFAGTLALLDVNPTLGEIPSEWIDTLIDPSARVQEGRYLRESRRVAAACDLSDGLADALNIFCTGGVGITLSESKFPMHPIAIQASEKTGVPLWKFAMGVGDWAIACVVSEKDVAAFRPSAHRDLDIFEVGRFDGMGRKLICDGEGAKHELPALVNEHFRRRLEDDGAYLKSQLYEPSQKTSI